MIKYINRKLDRSCVISKWDSFEWWENGRLVLNAIFFLIAVVFAITSYIISDGQSMPDVITLIGFAWLVINILYTTGFAVELIVWMLKTRKSSLDCLARVMLPTLIGLLAISFLLIAALLTAEPLLNPHASFMD